jgi:hypothetical protein
MLVHLGVVCGAFVGHAEHVVRFADFYKTCAGVWVVGVAVWMVLFAEGEVLPLYFGRGGGLRYV